MIFYSNLSRFKQKKQGRIDIAMIKYVLHGHRTHPNSPLLVEALQGKHILKSQGTHLTLALEHKV